MPLSYPVPRGTVVICDYSTGFRVPEMVKRRPVIVISGRLRSGTQLATVVPLSTTPPEQVEAHHVRMQMLDPLPAPFDATVSWVKCDMLATVGLWRLDLVRTGRDQGRRGYLKRQIPQNDLDRILRGVATWLGIRWETS